MATLAEIVTRLERRIIDLPTAVAAESQKLVEEAHREIQELHNFQTMEGLRAVSTAVGQSSLGAITVNIKDYKGQPWYTDDLGHTYFLRVTHDGTEVRRGFNQDPDLGLGRPRVLLHRRPEAVGDDTSANFWHVFPIPDGLAITADGEYNIQIPYYSYLAPTVDDWFTDHAEEFLLASATAEAFALNWDERRYAFWRAKAYGPLYDARNIMGGDLGRAIARDKRFKASHVDTLVPYMDVNTPKLRL